MNTNPPTPRPSDHEIIDWVLRAMAHQDGEVKFSREGESVKVVFADGVASPVIAFAPSLFTAFGDVIRHYNPSPSVILKQPINSDQIEE